jgi:hypothetical protein
MEDKFNDPEFIKDQRKRALKEMGVLKQMVYNWKNSYIRQIIEYEGKYLGDAESWEFLCTELMAEIEVHLYPYVQRFKDLKYITPGETQTFMSELYLIIDELRAEIPKVIEQREREQKIKEDAEKELIVQLEEMKQKYNELLERLEKLEGE